MNPSGYISGVNNVILGTKRMSQGFKSAVADSRVLDNQMKAISTTFRYALAGSIVFGVTGALSKLKDFENELGTIDALAGQLNSKTGNFQGLGNQLDDIGSQALVMSNKFGVAVTDVEAYIQRFYSTFQRPRGISSQAFDRQMQSYTNAVLNLQTALGSEAGDPAALAAGVGGLINAIPGGRRNPGKTATSLTNMIARLLQVTPSLSGTDIANAAGRLASVYNTSGMTPQELFAVYAQASKSGGSPSIITRGVQQLLGQSLLRPTTPTNKAAYSRAGLPTDPTSLRNMGGVAVLERLMNYVAPGGVSKKAAARARGASTVAGLQRALPGLNVTELYGLFGRIQSVQQFVNILSQGGVPALQAAIKDMDKFSSSTLAASMAQQNLHRQGITRINNAFSTMSVSLVRSLNTPLDKFATIVTKASDAIAKHRATTTAIEAGGASVLLLKLLGRTSAGASLLGRVPILNRLTGKVGRAAGAAIMAEETANVVSGVGADGSRANPFWVIISPYSWQFGTGGMGSPIGGGGKGGVENEVKKVLKNPLAQLAGGRAAGTALGAAAAPALVTGGAFYYAAKHQRQVDPVQFHKQQSSYMLNLLKERQFAQQHPTAKVEFKNNAKADITVHMVDPDGKKLGTATKKGVPLAITKDTAPQSGGRTGVKKGK